MKFGKETKEKVCKFDVEFSDKEFSFLKEYGLKEIKNDYPALVNYALNKILIKEIERKSKKND